MTYRVRDLMHWPVIAVPTSARLGDVFHKMVTFKVRHVVVLDDAGQPWGIVSDRDLRSQGFRRFESEAVPARLKEVEQIPVDLVASHPVVLVEPDDLATEAARRMLAVHVDALVIVEHGTPVGVVTSTDFVRFVADGRCHEAAPTERWRDGPVS